MLDYILLYNVSSTNTIWTPLSKRPILVALTIFTGSTLDN